MAGFPEPVTNGKHVNECIISFFSFLKWLVPSHYVYYCGGTYVIRAGQL